MTPIDSLKVSLSKDRRMDSRKDRRKDRSKDRKETIGRIVSSSKAFQYVRIGRIGRTEGFVAERTRDCSPCFCPGYSWTALANS